ncbi:MAG TPA: NADH-ubiquinone oxidoreductase-F iron-sulfur binding region domain-containing protein [Gaiellaceae bacterium]|nr:NADH-ubiquinone oxidoreductase-F iron-sulfur binding region domain-containing protein [Gaiellaceae bacterium]
MEPLLDDLPRERTELLANLGRIRREAGPVTPERADALADHMGLRRGEVAEVSAAYAYLGLAPETPRVCTGPVCECMGARELLERTPGAVETPCLGHCDLAPVALEGERLAGELRHQTNDGPSLHLSAPDEVRRPPELTAERVLAQLEAAGLVGYGGAGFPVWRKWQAVREHPGPRVVIVNADEGEPGTVKDRYVLELRPQLLLEGLELALRFCEASEAYVYLREEYTTARERLEAAIDERGLPVRIVLGAGSYVCGEETALLESMEGRRGMPRLRPPFPAESGHLGRPTLINNVETLAHVPAAARDGADWARTRLWSVSGAVSRPGCYEAPLDVTLRELIDEHAGGASEEVGAIVPGGAASGILPPSALDTPLTREALAEWGAGPGSGGVQVFPRRYPVQRLLAATMRFFAEESCQKCTPCRIGTRALRQVLAEAEEGRAAMPPARLEAWLRTMERGSICGLGQSAPLPLRTALRHFPDELEALR